MYDFTPNNFENSGYFYTTCIYLWYTMYGIHHYNGVHSDFSTTVGTSLMACYF